MQPLAIGIGVVGAGAILLAAKKLLAAPKEQRPGAYPGAYPGAQPGQQTGGGMNIPGTNIPISNIPLPNVSLPGGGSTPSGAVPGTSNQKWWVTGGAPPPISPQQIAETSARAAAYVAAVRSAPSLGTCEVFMPLGLPPLSAQCTVEGVFHTYFGLGSAEMLDSAGSAINFKKLTDPEYVAFVNRQIASTNSKKGSSIPLFPTESPLVGPVMAGFPHQMDAVAAHVAGL